MRTFRGTPKHLSRTGELDSFTYLMLNLPYECSYRCLKCFNLDDGSPIIPADAISLADRINLIHKAKGMGGKVVVIAGEGEPSLDRDIRTIISEISGLGMIPIIYSNGSTLTNELVEFYEKNNVSIMISFDSLNPKLYHKLTGGKGNLKKVMENIENTIKVYRNTRQTHGNLEILRLGMNATVSDVNADEIAKIKEHWSDDIYFVCNPLLNIGNANPNWKELMHDGSDPLKKHGQLIGRLSEPGGPLTTGSDNICGYYQWGIAVGPSGDYMICPYTKKTDQLLGSMRTTSLQDAFKNKHEIESHFKPQDTPCLVRSSEFNHYLQSLKSS